MHYRIFSFQLTNSTNEMEIIIFMYSGNSEEITDLSHRMSADGGCEDVVAARVRWGWVQFREGSEFLYERMFSNAEWGCLNELCMASNYVLF